METMNKNGKGYQNRGHSLLEGASGVFLDLSLEEGPLEAQKFAKFGLLSVFLGTCRKKVPKALNPVRDAHFRPEGPEIPL